MLKFYPLFSKTNYLKIMCFFN